MHEYIATYRIDNEEVFTTDTQVFNLDTTVLSEAAKTIEKELGGSVTLIELKRVV
jgi:hypothetical protein